MEYIATLLQDYQLYVPGLLIALSGLVLIFSIMLLSLHSKVSSLRKRYQRIMQGMEGVNIERMMVGHIDEVREALVTVDRLNNEARRLEDLLQSCIQRVGLVRFNAFEDTGSDLSFSLALLDDHDNGVVMSSLYGRSESRIYAKPVVNLQSSYVLTAEEQKAIRLAKATEKSSRPVAPPAALKREPLGKQTTSNLLTPEEKDLLNAETRKKC